MKCPICLSVNLVMAERQEIEIDYCPECRGVWLDRGELDKIIERSAPVEQPEYKKVLQHRTLEQAAHQTSHNQPYNKDHYGHNGHGQHYKKKKSLLSEIFDFD